MAGVLDNVAAALKGWVEAEKLLCGVVAWRSRARSAVRRGELALRESGGHDGEHGG